MKAQSATKQSRIFWNGQEWDAMIAHSPELATTQDNKRRFDLLMQAQRVLPKDRQRAKNTLWTCTVYKPDFTKNAMAKALKDATKHGQQPPPASAPTAPAQVEKPATNAARSTIHWSSDEYIALAHDNEVTPLLDKSRHPSVAQLVDAVIHAQARNLPKMRWRSRRALLQTGYKKGAHTLIALLRDAMRFPPPAPVVPPAAPPAVPDPAALEVVHTAADLGLDAQVANAMMMLARANVDVMLALMNQVRRDVMDTVRKETTAILRSTITEALDGQDGRVERNVRSTIVELLGGMEPPKPDFRADQSAENAAKAVIERAKLPRVDVVGLLNGQAEIVKKACGASFDLRFMGSNEVARQGITAPTAIVVTKFVGHDSQDRIKKFGAKLVYANGGPESVVKCLQEMQ